MKPRLRIDRSRFTVTTVPTDGRPRRTRIASHDATVTAYGDTPHKAWQVLTTYQHAVIRGR